MWLQIFPGKGFIIDLVYNFRYFRGTAGTGLPVVPEGESLITEKMLAGTVAGKEIEVAGKTAYLLNEENTLVF